MIISEFKKQKEQRERENNLWLLAIVIMIIFAFAIILIANFRLNSNAVQDGNTMRENLRTCKNPVVYGEGVESYVYSKGRKVYLIREKC